MLVPSESTHEQSYISSSSLVLVSSVLEPATVWDPAFIIFWIQFDPYTLINHSQNAQLCNTCKCSAYMSPFSTWERLRSFSLFCRLTSRNCLIRPSGTLSGRTLRAFIGCILLACSSSTDSAVSRSEVGGQDSVYEGAPITSQLLSGGVINIFIKSTYTSSEPDEPWL